MFTSYSVSGCSHCTVWPYVHIVQYARTLYSMPVCSHIMHSHDFYLPSEPGRSDEGSQGWGFTILSGKTVSPIPFAMGGNLLSGRDRTHLSSPCTFTPAHITALLHSFTIGSCASFSWATHSSSGKIGSGSSERGNVRIGGCRRRRRGQGSRGRERNLSRIIWPIWQATWLDPHLSSHHGTHHTFPSTTIIATITAQSHSSAPACLCHEPHLKHFPTMGMGET